MRRRARGIVGLVVLSLGLGAVTTYGVAWWLMNRSVPNPLLGSWAGHGDLGDDVGWLVSGEQQFGVTWFASQSVSFEGRVVVSRARGLRVPPPWSLVRSMSPSEVSAVGFAEPWFMMLKERAAGWPRLAVVDRTMEARSKTVSVGGHDLSYRHRGSSDPWLTTTLAFMPIWSGFLIDTAMFASVWAMLIRGPVLVRHWMRVGAGRCPKCRYDLSGLTGGVCPECGSAVKGV